MKFCYHAGYVGYQARNYSSHFIWTHNCPAQKTFRLYYYELKNVGGREMEFYTLRTLREQVDKHLFSLQGITAYCRILPHIVTTGVCSRTPSHWCNFCAEFCTFQTREQQTLSKSTQFAKKQKTKKQYFKKITCKVERLKGKEEDIILVDGLFFIVTLIT